MYTTRYYTNFNYNPQFKLYGKKIGDKFFYKDENDIDLSNDDNSVLESKIGIYHGMGGMHFRKSILDNEKLIIDDNHMDDEKYGSFNNRINDLIVFNLNNENIDFLYDNGHKITNNYAYIILKSSSNKDISKYILENFRFNKQQIICILKLARNLCDNKYILENYKLDPSEISDLLESFMSYEFKYNIFLYSDQSEELKWKLLSSLYIINEVDDFIKKTNFNVADNTEKIIDHMFQKKSLFFLYILHNYNKSACDNNLLNDLCILIFRQQIEFRNMKDLLKTYDIKDIINIVKTNSIIINYLTNNMYYCSCNTPNLYNWLEIHVNDFFEKYIKLPNYKLYRSVHNTGTIVVNNFNDLQEMDCAMISYWCMKTFTDDNLDNTEKQKYYFDYDKSFGYDYGVCDYAVSENSDEYIDETKYKMFYNGPAYVKHRNVII
jgi:hypothetical protein